MIDIFLSYASVDRPRVRVLAEVLEREGWSVWWDRIIPIGKAFDEAIESALAEARCVVVVWSQASIRSQWVRSEANDALDRGVLVPVLIEEVRIPLAFRRLQAAHMIDWQGETSHPGLRQLVQSISALLSMAPRASRLLPATSRAGHARAFEERPTTAPPSSPAGSGHEILLDHPNAPELVVIPPGTFMMGSPEDEDGRDMDEGPQHPVTITYSFAAGRHPVTFAQWEVCVADGGVSHRPSDEGWGRGTRPVINVSWDDVQLYTQWLTRKTGREYRLLTEAEWEYAARAGTTTRYSWGDTITARNANYADSRNRMTTEVCRYPANANGLYDVLGNVWEWVEDCWHDSYEGAPADGSAWKQGGNSRWRVLRGGAWNCMAGHVRSAVRGCDSPGRRSMAYRFRVARILSP